MAISDKLTEDQPIIKPYMESHWSELGDDYRNILLESLHQRWVALLYAPQDSDFSHTFVW